MKKILRITIPLLLLVGLLFTNLPYQWLTQRTVENVLIKDKQVTTQTVKKEDKVVSTYLIFTDHGVYRNDDAGWFVKFDSSDFYGDLDTGKRYDLKIYGWRIPILSMYPNIVRMKQVKDGAKRGLARG